MHLNHLDLQVHDVPLTAAFLERYFGFAIRGNRTSPAIIILDGAGELTLVLQRRREGERFPHGFHVGFLVDDEVTVRSQHQRLRGDGIGCSDLIDNARGLFFYLDAPGDFTIEVGCRPGARRG